MNLSSTRWQWMVFGLAICLAGGCATKQVEQQRDALIQENSELRNELDVTRLAVEAANSTISDLETQLSSGLVQPGGMVNAMATNTGFESIPGVEADYVNGQITVRIAGDILFSSGKISLKKSARSTLDKIARIIRSDYSDKTIRIAGYTDSDPIRKSKWADNLELSLQRAAAVHRYLQKQGVDPKQLYAAGHGQWKPRETKAKSRRVELVVVLDE